MTFDATELSAHDGSPVIILEFRYGAQYFRYTNQADPVTYSGQIFEPLALHVGSVKRGEPANQLSIEASGRIPVAELFRIQPPFQTVSLTVRNSHFKDTAGEWLVVWKGDVIGAEWSQSGQRVTLTAESIGLAGERLGLRRPFQRGCPYALYDEDCRVAPASYEAVVSSFSVAGLVVSSTTFTGFAANYFAGGYIQYTDPTTGAASLISIRAHDNSAGTVTLVVAPLHIAGVASFSAYPGCDHTMDTCIARFANRFNYGGMILLPELNPYRTLLF